MITYHNLQVFIRCFQPDKLIRRNHLILNNKLVIRLADENLFQGFLQKKKKFKINFIFDPFFGDNFS